MVANSPEKQKAKFKFKINDHKDILVEVLKRLDGRSLGVASCVCRLWWSIAHSDDSVWEHVCFRHVSPPGARPVVLALGGYKRLYMVCLRPVLGRFGWPGRSDFCHRVWTRQGAQLLLSLFCVDYYEKLNGNLGNNARIGGSNTNECGDASSSLMFLCKPVNV